MKKNIQALINICFLVSIIALIYHNNVQQDKIDLIKLSANFDESSLTTRFDEIIIKLREIEEINNLQEETFKSWQLLLNEKSSQIFNNQENLKITEKNVLILFDDRNKHREAINENIEVTKRNSMQIEALIKYTEKMVKNM
jgi:hypothetical protein